jgi:hypothetical protein
MSVRQIAEKWRIGKSMVDRILQGNPPSGHATVPPGTVACPAPESPAKVSGMDGKIRPARKPTAAEMEEILEK